MRSRSKERKLGRLSRPGKGDSHARHTQPHFQQFAPSYTNPIRADYISSGLLGVHGAHSDRYAQIRCARRTSHICFHCTDTSSPGFDYGDHGYDHLELSQEGYFGRKETISLTQK